ncbi:hypothetical protein ACFL6H_10540, partial [Candidatus Latescibacterota bacterium]
PDEQARKEISQIDGERIENKYEPLSGPYHYNGHLMILYWDLIEESPFFTDEQRLRITNAFSKQLEHRMENFVDYEEIKGITVYSRKTPFPGIGNRHASWGAVCLYCLGRYFQKDYPNPIWNQCMEGPKMLFAALNKDDWINENNDNLMWQSTAIEPVIIYLRLSGERVPVENGNLRKVMHGLEILASGRPSDMAWRYASIGMLNSAAYLLQGSRYVYYRQHLNFDMNIFRIGQSFWPEKRLHPEQPHDLVNNWSIYNLSDNAWKARKNGFTKDESFRFGSWRSTADASGDFILLDGFNGQCRNPYHSFAVLQLRIEGLTLLDGYRNQVQTLSEGMSEPRIAMNAALRYRDVIGLAAIAVGEVPDAVYCNWRRSLLQRTGRYVLVADELIFRENSTDMEVQIMWETSREIRKATPANGVLILQPSKNVPQAQQEHVWNICLSDPLETTSTVDSAIMQLHERTEKGQHQVFFSVIAQNPYDPAVTPSCVRVAENAAALALPEPAVAVVGTYEDIEGELVILAVDHLTGKSLKKAGPGNFVSASLPVNIDWDFSAGRINMVNDKETIIRLALATGSDVRIDGKPAVLKQDGLDVFILSVAAGEHIIENITPPPSLIQKNSAYLETLLKVGRNIRPKSIEGVAVKTAVNVPSFNKTFTAKVGSSVVDLAVIPSKSGSIIYTAESSNIHVFNADGSETM